MKQQSRDVTALVGIHLEYQRILVMTCLCCWFRLLFAISSLTTALRKAKYSKCCYKNFDYKTGLLNCCSWTVQTYILLNFNISKYTDQKIRALSANCGNVGVQYFSRWNTSWFGSLLSGDEKSFNNSVSICNGASGHDPQRMRRE